MTALPWPADRHLDLRGLACPLPVLKARKALIGLAPGQRLSLAATDPLAAVDIPHFCKEAGHVLVNQKAGDGTFWFLIARGPALAGSAPEPG